MPSAYLDTNIISGLAKGEYSEEVASAFIEITALSKRGALELRTSELTAQELQRIPPEYRRQHFIIYNLIKNIALKSELGHSNIVLGGMGSGNIVAYGLGQPLPPKLIQELEALIPVPLDPLRAEARSLDISHLFQCKHANIDYFLTEDHKTIIRYKLELEKLGLKVVSSLDLIDIVK